MEIRYEHLNPENFDAYSLDTFQRRQAVKECWRYVDGMWQLRPVSFEENWDLPQLREIAGDIAAHMTVDQSAFGAFAGDQAVGFITVSHRLFGRSARYAELVYFMVSEPFRGRGIGRASPFRRVPPSPAASPAKLPTAGAKRSPPRWARFPSLWTGTAPGPSPATAA